MESVHLFTSLMILRLAITLNLCCPGSFDQELDDAGGYEAGKDLLVSMMDSGSLAAKGHIRMMKYVEDMGDAIAIEGEVRLDFHESKLDLDDWMGLMFDTGDSVDTCEGQLPHQ